MSDTHSLVKKHIDYKRFFSNYLYPARGGEGEMLKKLVFILGMVVATVAYANKDKPLVVVLDWFVNPNHAPLFVAEQEGFFKAQHLKVKFIAPADTAEGEKMVAVGKADVALTYQPTLLYKINAGLPLVRFATLIDKPLDSIIVLKDGSIHSIGDLKGKKIGYSTPGTDNMMLKTMLKYNGVDINDVELINVRFDLTQALLAGKIDAFTGGSRNFEPLAMEIAGKPARAFYPEENGFPLYDELILVTHKDRVHDARLARFVKALKLGVAYLEKNPQQSWNKFAQHHPELNNTLNKKAWLVTLPYFAKDPAKLDVDKYDALARFMYQMHLIGKAPPVADYAIEIKNEKLK